MAHLSKNSGERTVFDLQDVLSTLKVPLDKAGKAVDLFKVAVLEAFGDTHLPYLYEILGREKFLQVLDVFQGSELMACSHCGGSMSWPARDELAEIMRDLIIYFQIKNAKVGRRAKITLELADDFGMTPGQVRHSYKKMSDRAERHLKHF
jgi:hypothetical protein